VLIYVFDVNSNDWQKDLQFYYNCIDALDELSKDAKIFVLVHKMDLIPEAQREREFKAKRAEIQGKSKSFAIQCFQTSIWNETLYKAWSAITSILVP